MLPIFAAAVDSALLVTSMFTAVSCSALTSALLVASEMAFAVLAVAVSAPAPAVNTSAWAMVVKVPPSFLLSLETVSSKTPKSKSLPLVFWVDLTVTLPLRFLPLLRMSTTLWQSILASCTFFRYATATEICALRTPAAAPARTA